MFSVEPRDLDPTRLRPHIGETRWHQLSDTMDRVREALGDHKIWHVNATATGGGVAEMLQFTVPYWRGFGFDSRWMVLEGEGAFFATTKRLHNLLHGVAGDGHGLSEEDRQNYEQVLEKNLADFAPQVEAGDIVVLHDPQTAGMIGGLVDKGAYVIWRSHIGRDEPNEYTEQGWAFLQPYIDRALAVVVSRAAYAPPSVSPEQIIIISPCIDPFSAKNRDLDEDVVTATLAQAGLVTGATAEATEFPRQDGSIGTTRKHDSAVVEGGPWPVGARYLLQVSRWDRLKDMTGVMRGFVEHVKDPEAHLVLCGPSVEGVTDDPEGAEVLAQCRALHGALPREMRERVHLVCLPMDDTEENAHMVNALQRHAHTVIQKSLFEGFGLTVTEAMWKARPVVASAVGGIKDQISNDRDGLLIQDATDLEALGAALNRLLDDPELARRLGQTARHHVLVEFLGDTNILKFANLFLAVLSKD